MKIDREGDKVIYTVGNFGSALVALVLVLIGVAIGVLL